VFLSQRDFVGIVGWTLCATAFFIEFGSMSLLSWAAFAVAGALPPLMFIRLAQDSREKEGRAHEASR